MTRWFTILAAVIIASNSAVYAQGFAATLAYLIGDPLTTTCESSTPLPEGYVVKIFWDSDGDGSDFDDPQPVPCTLPDCIEPYLSVTFNEFTMNGVAQGFSEGYFLTFDAFQSIGGMPSPPRYFLRIYESDNITPLWTSNVITLIATYQDVYFAQGDWTCGGLGPQCTVIDETE